MLRAPEKQFVIRPYQEEGVSFLVKRSSALLADEMGLGKTAQVICAIQLLQNKRDLHRVLIICPSSLRLNWQDEFVKWAPEIYVLLTEGSAANRRAQYALPVPVIVSSYDHIRLDSEYFLRDDPFGLVVLDEVQVVKNARSETSLACRSIPRKRAWTMTGTPIENSPDDLSAIFSFIKRGLISPGMPPSEVHNRIRPFFLRRTKQDVSLELPPIIEQEIQMPLTIMQYKAYQRESISNTSTLLLPSRAANLLAMITRLKQICNFEAESGSSSKMDTLELAMESISCGPKKILIFSQYVETLKWISTRLKSKWTFRIFTGSLDEAQKHQIVQEFQGAQVDMVLLMSLKAGGVGLNLTAADMVVLFDRWWNPAVEDQAIARANRFGRTGPLHVLKFLVKDTVEERISAVLERKKAIFEQFIETAQNAEVPRLTKEELEWILTGRGRHPE